MPEARSDHLAAVVGDYLWVYGGRDAERQSDRDGPARQRDDARGRSRGAGRDPGSDVGRVGLGDDAGPATCRSPGRDATGYVANGAMYLVGGIGRLHDQA